MTGSGDTDDRVDRDVEKIVVNGNFQGDLANHTGLGFHPAINRNLVFALGEFLGIAYGVSRDTDAGKRFGQCPQTSWLNYGDNDLHKPIKRSCLASLVRQIITEINAMNDPKIRSLLAEFYPAWISANAAIRSLGNAGGFSGARFWRIESDGSSLVLRRWPESATDSMSRIRWSHDVLREANNHGCQFVPVPLKASSGESLVFHDTALWQLEPWMPGAADFGRSPTPCRLKNVIKALATFHRSVQHLDFARETPASLAGRTERLRFWFVDDRFTEAFSNLQIQVSGHPALSGVGESICRQFQLVAKFVEQDLARTCDTSVDIQPVIADVWHDHVLLTGDEVTGIVDFGAMKRDSVSLDLGRLIGSLVGDDQTGWNAAVDAYRSIRPLAEAEVWIARILDFSGTVLAGLNWLNWICVENRQFGPADVVFNRIQRIGLRMETMAKKL